MIVLDYSLDEAAAQKLEAIDLGNILATQLDYYLFCGDITFRVDDAVFDTRWGWVPVVDFATQLYCVLADIANGETKYLEFTESAAQIQFQRIGEEVVVSGDYCSASSRTRLDEIRAAARGFLARVLGDLSAAWPDLKRSPAFRERMDLLLRK